MSVKRMRDRSVELRKSPRSRPTPNRPKAEPLRQAPAPQSVATLPAKAAVPAALPSTIGNIPLPDFEKLSVNLARATDQGQKALAAYMKSFEAGETQSEVAAQVADCVNTLGQVAEHWLNDANRAIEAQTKLATGFIDLWGQTLKRMTGEAAEPVVPPDPSDKRFADPKWQELPFFDFLRQAYRLSSDWAEEIVEKTDLDANTRKKAMFYVRQITSALSPSNFIGTNPELLYATAETSGENLARGMKMLAEDITAGKGSLKIRQSDPTKFQLGINMAMSPGKVVWRNELMELIQYSPTTEEVYKRPLLIVPPWINKFYVLDLNPEKSFIRFAVEQGLTVFVISWVNPDERHADKSFEHYMQEAFLRRSTQSRKRPASAR